MKLVAGQLDGLEIGERIALIRKRNGLSKKELADILNISVQTLSNYESNKTVPSLDTICAMATALGVTMNMIVHGREPKKEQKPLITSD